MRVDAADSVYQEIAGAENEFSPEELKHARMVLRRLRFLEKMVNKNGSVENPMPALEADALAWALDELGYLAVRESASA